ncbi:hypothetical protein D6829_01215 [Candidatus Pacearchaeota archaeon]|nr:MAG: hypothetical protein D6829_01215 [Candidatus Pacearchaeota archaeon]
MKKKKRKNKTSLQDFLVVGVIIVAIILAYLLLNQSNDQKIKINVIRITAPNCQNCLDTSKIMQGILKSEKDLIVSSEKKISADSDEGRKITEKYKISRVPAIVIFSNKIDKVNVIQGLFKIENNVAIFEKAVPYLDLQSGEVKGIVKISQISKDCKECPKPSQIEGAFKRLGVVTDSNVETIDVNSDKAKKIFNETKVKFYPMFLISKEIEEYWWVMPQLSHSLGKIKEGYFLKSPLPPYFDKDGIKRGLVKLTIIYNKSCSDCFNMSSFKSALERAGIFIANEQLVDVSSLYGKSLIKKYNISKIPSLIISKDIIEYTPILKELNNTGTFEKDGNYVLRNLGNVRGFQKINASLY